MAIEASTAGARESWGTPDTSGTTDRKASIAEQGRETLA
jgi:hypothetical protein